MYNNTYHLGNEAALCQSQESPQQPEAPACVHASLCHAEASPDDNSGRRVAERPDLLADKTPWELGSQEADQVDSLARIVVICRHAQVSEHVVRYSTVDVAANEVHGREHDPDPEHDAPVQLAKED